MWRRKQTAPIESKLKDIPFIKVAGEPSDKPLTLFALSTCGFCRRAIAFLQDHNIAYQYVYMDQLPREQQDIIRSYVKKSYRVSLSFPFLCLGEADYLSGFIKVAWEKELINE
ncbi:MAG: glutaredoxin domain-containing protein [Sphaerochaetaceae bacterium]|jgi:glutaredoxin|nr:glutaredoxin domain-containing protein [Sphaerochaetaceae bacterium]MDD3365773.1 glutaredoxin domain-containing protein [Sphaerochaetaceae bacterium]MDD4220139.1 glutaredoxin domain-containing protein [Sphaerochaetaceae bacterium]MDY0370813.1 glutaredoxin domain-containing protein [Sphaerochaetaceae bacterium]